MYTLILNRGEIRSLNYIARCYESAHILINGATIEEIPESENFLYSIPENIAWEYKDALPGDWSFPEGEDCPNCIPPLAGGSLAEKLEAFYLEII